VLGTVDMSVLGPHIYKYIYFFQASLQKQIKDLDPTGEIQKFLSTGGARPDITDVINRKLKPKKGAKKTEKKTEPKSGNKTVKKIEKIKQEYDDDDEVYMHSYMYKYRCIYVIFCVSIYVYM
jgi:hypothetical protein